MENLIYIDAEKLKEKRQTNIPIFIRISAAEKESIDTFCKENGLKRAAFVRNLIKAYFKSNS